MEIEPLRRIGIDISAARLQQELYALGIDKSVESLSQADKALLRYIATMKQTTNAQSDMARTLETPANALRVLQAQVEIASRWIGAIFLPILAKLVNFAIAVVKAIGQIAKSIATIFGFEMPEIKMPETSISGLSDMETGLEDVSDSAKEAKKNVDNLTGGFDELNILNAEETSATGAEAGTGVGNILGDIDLSGYNPFEGLVDTSTTEQAEKIREVLEKILSLVVGIGVAFLTWKIGNTIFNTLDKISEAVKKIKTSLALSSLPVTLYNKFGETAVKLGLFAGVIAIIVARFTYLATTSESFQKGLSRIGDIADGVFGVLGDILGGISTVLKDIGKEIISWLPESVQNAILGFFETIGAFLDKLDLDFGDLAITIGGIALLFMGGPFSIAGAALLAFEAITVGIRALGGISDEEWTAIKDKASETWTAIKDKVHDVVDWVSTKIEEIKFTFVLTVKGIKDIFSGIITFIKGVFTGDWKMAWEGIKQTVLGVIETTFAIRNWIKIGKNIIEGLLKGIAGIAEVAKKIGDSLINGIKSVLGIHSPSTVMRDEVGIYVTQGIAEGMKSEMGSVIGVANEMANGVQKVFDGISYNTATDYMALINEAKALGDMESAAMYEQIRNAKIAGENLSYSQTYEFTEAFEPISNELSTLNATQTLFGEEESERFDLETEMLTNNTNSVTSEMEKISAELTNSLKVFKDEQMLNFNKVISAISSAASRIVASTDKIRIEVYNTYIDGESKSSKAKGYATGGYPQKAQLFYARENGMPEMVGQIGNQTAVANNEQITGAIENAVYRAMEMALRTSPSQEINLNITTELDGETVYRNQQKVSASKGYNFGMGAFAR